MTMVVGKFEQLASAQHAVADLVTSGYPRSCISVLVHGTTNDSQDKDALDSGALARATDSAAVSSVLAAGPLGAAIRSCTELSTAEAVANTLASAGLKPIAARFFADAICQGAILVAVHCRDPYIRDARDILDTHADEGEQEPYVSHAHSSP